MHCSSFVLKLLVPTTIRAFDMIRVQRSNREPNSVRVQRSSRESEDDNKSDQTSQPDESVQLHQTEDVSRGP